MTNDDLAQMPVGPASSDLAYLRQLTPPPASRIVQTTIMMIVAALLLSIAGLVYALRVTIINRDSLSDSLTCVRASSVELDIALANGQSAMLDDDAVILDALVGVAETNPQRVQAALDEAERLVALGRSAKVALDDAIAARSAALTEC